ncbi:WD40/YVTN/BNR-like repeat-containing protein [Leeuwenhoekiella marinoflava]|uniref:BNR/Asp-box repeat protein n=2 Tax=Leeuwenhoekiella marinoflava TaxID=988 RepID=A0A4V1KS31_9FLAO|nr:oxidoreductase [Leeuwenhoekiella marinoflava]RXG27202.1 BNR/Asp-box repeat protein [Leeuwenhoekiella marinoflava]SHF78547.1 BNR/Asp-box repeat-containing protein [Leeuwenhoekiella marinoflava DSM 3653]
MYRSVVLFSLLALMSCGEKSAEKNEKSGPVTGITVEPIYNDTVSIRTLDILNDGSVAFAGNDGKYGLYNTKTQVWSTNILKADTLAPSFRAIAHTASDFFMLSIANPALLYKTGDDGQMQVVYEEVGPKVFYDSMKFWDDKEGIAMGDPTESCLSILITRDGGSSWEKVSCENLPETAEGEAAFAASNTNIAVQGDDAWIITGGMKSRVFHTGDRGENWEVFETPLKQGEPTFGGYSIDFYDEQIGFIIGGDYLNPEGNTRNKALSTDGGKTWTLVADGKEPNHRSCVKFVPGHDGSELIATGANGISYSKDQGKNWTKLTDEGFYVMQFVNDTLAYAAGANRVAKLKFSR